MQCRFISGTSLASYVWRYMILKLAISWRGYSITFLANEMFNEAQVTKTTTLVASRWGTRHLIEVASTGFIQTQKLRGRQQNPVWEPHRTKTASPRKIEHRANRRSTLKSKSNTRKEKRKSGTDPCFRKLRRYSKRGRLGLRDNLLTRDGDRSTEL